MSGMDGDKYRSYLHGEGELNTNWRYGGPPNYDIVNKLFEDERTKVFPLSLCTLLVLSYIHVGVYFNELSIC